MLDEVILSGAQVALPPSMVEMGWEWPVAPGPAGRLPGISAPRTAPAAAAPGSDAAVQDLQAAAAAANVMGTLCCRSLAHGVSLPSLPGLCNCHCCRSA